MHQHGGDIYSNQNVIDFSANINYLGMPESVKRAALAAVERSVHYPDAQCRELRAAIGARDLISPEDIFCGNGAADVIFSLVLAKKPGQALLPVPSFYEYRQALLSVGCRITEYPLRRENGFCLTEEILPAITEQTDLLFLCNPNNPTGELIEPELLRRIVRRCGRTGTLLILDECFNDFLQEPQRHSLIPLYREYRQLFLVRAFTKMYAIPGLRLGYGVCGDRRLIEKMEQVSQPWRVSVPAQAAGIAAARESGFAGQSRDAVARRREELIAGMRSLGYRIYGSKANFVFFEGEIGLWEKMRAKGFLIRDCGNYPGLRPGYYRAAVRGEEENGAFLRALSEIRKEQGWQRQS